MFPYIFPNNNLKAPLQGELAKYLPRQTPEKTSVS